MNRSARAKLACSFALSDKGSSTVCGCSPDHESCCDSAVPDLLRAVSSRSLCARSRMAIWSGRRPARARAMIESRKDCSTKASSENHRAMPSVVQMRMFALTLKRYYEERDRFYDHSEPPRCLPLHPLRWRAAGDPGLRPRGRRMMAVRQPPRCAVRRDEGGPWTRRTAFRPTHCSGWVGDDCQGKAVQACYLMRRAGELAIPGACQHYRQNLESLPMPFKVCETCMALRQIKAFRSQG